MSIRARKSSAASISRRSPSRRRPAAFAAAARRRCSRRRRSPGRAKPPRRTPIISTGPTTPRELPGTFQYGEVVTWLRDRLPKDAIVCNGAGNYAGWLHRYHRFRRFATQLAPTSGSMGYGVPAAVLAKRQYPERDRRRLCRRRLLPDERPGIRDRRAVRLPRSSSSSSTTRSTAPSACIRSATIPAASSAPSCKNPDFATVRPGLRRPWRARRAHRGVRAGLRARARLGQAVDPALPASIRARSRSARISCRSGEGVSDARKAATSPSSEPARSA